MITAVSALGIRLVFYLLDMSPYSYKGTHFKTEGMVRELQFS